MHMHMNYDYESKNSPSNMQLNFKSDNGELNVQVGMHTRKHQVPVHWHTARKRTNVRGAGSCSRTSKLPTRKLTQGE